MTQPFKMQSITLHNHVKGKINLPQVM